MRTQTREKLFSIFTSLTLLSQYVIGIFSYLPAPVYAAVSVNLDQYANKAPAGWQNGNLNSTNSEYAEGDSVIFGINIIGLIAGSHTIHMNYDFTAAGIRAYDYLSDYDLSESGINPCDGLSASLCSSFASVVVPGDSNANNQPPGEIIRVYGGTGTPTLSSYTLDGLLTGNSTKDVTLSFDSNGSEVLIVWGGHIASSVDYGPGQGAGSISGSPFHMRTQTLDGEGGNKNQDKSIQPGSIIIPATITVIKNIDPVDSSTWDFNLNLTDSSLVGTATDISHGETYTFNNLPPDSYTLSEVTNPTIYTTAVSCVNEADQETGTGSVDSVELDLAEGDDVTCTFTNTIIKGSITVDKVTNPAGSTQSFDFTLGDDGSGSTSLTDQQTPHTFADLLPGTYSLTEGAVTGWDLTGVVCSDQSDPSSISLSAGEDVTCTFTNERLPILTVVKDVVNDYGTVAQPDDFDLKIDNLSVDSGVPNVVTTGSYTVGEDLTLNPDGYLLTSISSPCDSEGNILLSYGDDVTCTITNTAVAPQLTVIKHVVKDNGGGAFASDFTMSVTGTEVSDPSFPGDEDGTTVTPDAGSYSVGESGPDGYSASYSADCSGTIDIGETKICTITNDDIAPSLTLYKSVDNGDGGNAFYLDW